MGKQTAVEFVVQVDVEEDGRGGVLYRVVEGGEQMRADWLVT